MLNSASSPATLSAGAALHLATLLSQQTNTGAVQGTTDGARTDLTFWRDGYNPTTREDGPQVYGKYAGHDLDAVYGSASGPSKTFTVSADKGDIGVDLKLTVADPTSTNSAYQMTGTVGGHQVSVNWDPTAKKLFGTLDGQKFESSKAASQTLSPNAMGAWDLQTQEVGAAQGGAIQLSTAHHMTAGAFNIPMEGSRTTVGTIAGAAINETSQPMVSSAL